MKYIRQYSLLIIENQAFSSYDLAPSLKNRDNLLTGKGGERGGERRSHNIDVEESWYSVMQ
jgi:hypothetical protein